MNFIAAKCDQRTPNTTQPTAKDKISYLLWYRTQITIPFHTVLLSSTINITRRSWSAKKSTAYLILFCSSQKGIRSRITTRHVIWNRRYYPFKFPKQRLLISCLAMDFCLCFLRFRDVSSEYLGSALNSSDSYVRYVIRYVFVVSCCWRLCWFYHIFAKRNYQVWMMYAW